MDTADKFRTYDDVRTYSPILACEIGVNQAIFVRQLEYWIGTGKSGKNIDGRQWIRDAIREWHDQLPHWSIRTIRRIVKRLTDNHILDFRTDLNRHGYDRTRWYTINFTKINQIFDESELTVNVGDKYRSNKKRPDRTHGSGQSGHKQPDNLDATIPKHSSKNSSEKESTSEEDDQAKGVIDMLDKKANKSFRYGKNNMGYIKARIKEGYSSENFAYVIMNKVADWGNSDMDKFIRPKTLFTEQHMDDYLNEKQMFSSSSNQGRKSSAQKKHKTTEQVKDEREKEEMETERKLKEQLEGRNKNE